MDSSLTGEGQRSSELHAVTLCYSKDVLLSLSALEDGFQVARRKFNLPLIALIAIQTQLLITNTDNTPAYF